MKTNLKNSDVIKKTLFSLVFVAKTKTTKDYAWTVVKNLLIEFESKYDFLNYIQIDDVKNLHDSVDDIYIKSKFDKLEPKKIGDAFQDIIDTFKTRMGTKAGYFFLREFKEVLGERYFAILKNMGVDLRLIDLEKQIYGYKAKTYKIKDKFDSNIAYLEKE